MSVTSEDRRMQVCPRCHGRFPPSVVLCPLDETPLVAATGSTPAVESRAAPGPVDPVAATELGQLATARSSLAQFGELAPGTTVGDYVVKAKLGEGGMGTVYLGEHPVIGKRVAIKIISPQLSTDERAAQRFVQEARAVNQINHRNIVDIFMIGQLPDGRHFLVMEYLEGETLKARLERGALGLDAALDVVLPLCDALAAAHEAKVVHRDLKPDNVHLVRDRTGVLTVKLLDFGIAKLNVEDAQGPTKTGAPVGTPLYMAPEQCTGGEVDARADVYAFGVMLYEILSGKTPFPAGSFFDVITRKLRERVPPPETPRPLPKLLVELLMACLQVDPANRPASMIEVRGALLAVARQEGVSITGYLATGEQVSASGAWLRRTRRRWLRRIAIGGTLAVLGATGAAVVILRTGVRAPATLPEPAPRPAAPAPSAPATADLVLRTRVPGARFTVDGNAAGDASGTLDLAGLAPGAHEIVVAADGRRERREKLTLGPGHHELEWLLEPAATTKRPAARDPRPAGPAPASKKSKRGTSDFDRDPFAE